MFMCMFTEKGMEEYTVNCEQWLPCGQGQRVGALIFYLDTCI